MVKALRKKKFFDGNADWVPAKRRSFTLKEKTREAEDTQPAVERDLSFALKGPAISDAQALEKAYEAPGSTYTYGDNIFVARTKGTPLLSSDWMQNYKYLSIPWLLGKPVETYKADRFKDVERAREATPYPNKGVGHSLGGSVLIEMQKKRRRFHR